MKRLLPACLAAFLAACALSGAPRDGRAPRAAPVDALIPSGRSLFLLDFAQGRYQRWRLADSCRLGDTLAGGWNASRNWLSLATPGTPFAAVAAAAGPSGHFFLLDRIGRRLALYDTNAQFLSALPLPEEAARVNPERLEVHWTRDNLFTFLDLAGGAAWQFAERRTSGGGGQGDWRLVHRVRLPVGLTGCVWEPFRRDPCCRIGEAGPVRCFDRYFNPVDSSALEAPPAGTGGAQAADAWDIRVSAEAGDWRVRVGVGAGCAGGAPLAACWHPGRRSLEACPADEATAPPAP